MVKYLILGNGYIGNKFNEYLEDTIICKERINSIRDVLNQINVYDPDIIINCIGKTGRPNVDWCELNKEETFFSNVTIPMLIAEACKYTDKYMVHIGSGCIYEGNNGGDGYYEDDEPNFRGSFYSRTKIYSEQILKDYNNILIIRIRMPIDNKPSPRNLIDKLINYKQVINVPNSITYIPDLMKIAKELMDKKERGIFNVVNEGPITHKQILELYKDIVDQKFKMPEFIPIEKLNTLAQRSNCILNIRKLKETGIKVRSSLNAVESCMKGYAINAGKNLMEVL